MNVKISETGKIETLDIIDSRSGVSWVQDLIGNAGALNDGQFTWSEEDDAYLADQYTFDWWAIYIADSEQTEREAEALADRLNMSFEDVFLHISQHTGDDYESHRHEAVRAMRELEEEIEADEEEDRE